MPRDVRIENTAVAREHLLSPRFAPENIAVRESQVFAPHVKVLNEWVEKLRSDPELPQGAGRTIPWFDPRGGGQNAAVLFLMQDPSEVATFTGFISPDNNDPTANNSTLACEDAGLSSRDRVHWNVYPWWVNILKKGRPVDPTRPAQTYSQAMNLAVPHLTRLLTGLLPKLKVIVLLGGHSQRGFDRFLANGGRLPSHLPEPLRCPSCSPQSWNNIEKKSSIRRSELIKRALSEACEIAGLR